MHARTRAAFLDCPPQKSCSITYMVTLSSESTIYLIPLVGRDTISTHGHGHGHGHGVFRLTLVASMFEKREFRARRARPHALLERRATMHPRVLCMGCPAPTSDRPTDTRRTHTSDANIRLFTHAAHFVSVLAQVWQASVRTLARTGAP